MTLYVAVIVHLTKLPTAMSNCLLDGDLTLVRGARARSPQSRTAKSCSCTPVLRLAAQCCTTTRQILIGTTELL